MLSKSYSVEAVVLRKRALGEADRILTLFTRERGKLDAVAKGARKVRSKFGARLDFFSRVRLLVHAGRSLDVISSAKSLRTIWEHIVDPEAYAAASYVAEAIDALCEPDLAVPELYEALCDFQEALSAGTDKTALLAAVDMRILSALGFNPELDACARCGAVLGKRPLERGRAWLSPQACGLLCNACVRHMRAEPAESAAAGGLLSVGAADFARLRRLREADLTNLPSGGTWTAINRVTKTFVEYQMGRRSRVLSSAGAGAKLARASARGA